MRDVYDCRLSIVSVVYHLMSQWMYDVDDCG